MSSGRKLALSRPFSFLLNTALEQTVTYLMSTYFKKVLKLRAPVCASKLRGNCNCRLKYCKEIKERHLDRQESEGNPKDEAKDRVKQITKKSNTKKIEFYPRMRWHLASCGL